MMPFIASFKNWGLKWGWDWTWGHCQGSRRGSRWWVTIHQCRRTNTTYHGWWVYCGHSWNMRTLPSMFSRTCILVRWKLPAFLSSIGCCLAISTSLPIQRWEMKLNRLQRQMQVWIREMVGRWVWIYRMIRKFVMSLKVVMVVRCIKHISSWLAGREMNVGRSERRDCGRWRTSQLQDSLWRILWSLLLPLPLWLCMGAPIGSMGAATGARHSIHSQSKAGNGGIWTRDIDESSSGKNNSAVERGVLCSYCAFM